MLLLLLSRFSKDIEDLNNTVDQMNWIDIYKIFYIIASEYTFFSGTHITFFRRDHMLDNKCQ